VGTSLLLTYDFPPHGGGIARMMGELALRFPPQSLIVSTGRCPRGTESDARLPQPVDRAPIQAKRLRTLHGMALWSWRAGGLVRRYAPGFTWCGNLKPAAFHRQIPGIKRSNRIPRQLYSRQRCAAVINTLHKILKFLRIPVLPTLIRSGEAPPLLGVGLLHNVNVLQYILPGIEGLQAIDRIHIAPGAVVVTKHFHPVVDPTHHQFRGKYIRDRPIGKGDVNLRIIFNIVIPGAQKTFIAIIR